MIKADIVRKVSQGTGVGQREVAAVVDGVLETIMDELLNDGRIELRGFGTFKVVNRQARGAMNPVTRERITVPGKKMPVFRPSSVLKKKMQAR